MRGRGGGRGAGRGAGMGGRGEWNLLYHQE